MTALRYQEVPEPFLVNVIEDIDIQDLSFIDYLGKFAYEAYPGILMEPTYTWYVDRDWGRLVHAANTLEVQTYPVRFVSNAGYRTFYPMYIPTKEELLAFESEDDLIAVHGSVEDAIANRILDDHERAEGFLSGDWHMVACRMKLTYGKGPRAIELAHASLGGVESDCEEEYKQMIFEDLFTECIEEALNDAEFWLMREALFRGAKDVLRRTKPTSVDVMKFYLSTMKEHSQILRFKELINGD